MIKQDGELIFTGGGNDEYGKSKISGRIINPQVGQTILEFLKKYDEWSVLKKDACQDFLAYAARWDEQKKGFIGCWAYGKDYPTLEEELRGNMFSAVPNSELLEKLKL